MKREIKFRAWVDGCMITWNPDFFSDMSPVTNFDSNFPDEYSDVILMQYTGLKDANGVEIYEGDAIRHLDGHICEIIFKHGSFQMTYLNGSEQGITRRFFISAPYCTVIGNIYEHKHLLENGKQPQ